MKGSCKIGKTFCKRREVLGRPYIINFHILSDQNCNLTYSDPYQGDGIDTTAVDNNFYSNPIYQDLREVPGISETLSDVSIERRSPISSRRIPLEPPASIYPSRIPLESPTPISPSRVPLEHPFPIFPSRIPLERPFPIYSSRIPLERPFLISPTRISLERHSTISPSRIPYTDFKRMYKKHPL